MALLYVKAVHIIGVVAWFAALFYLVRLFVYHTEALDRPESESKVLADQFEIMEKRLLRIIGNPAMIVTLVAGIWLMMSTQAFREGWMHVKLLFVAFLIAYHMVCARIRKQLLNRRSTWTSKQLRLFNEVATLFLVVIVCLAAVREPIAAAYGVVGLGALGAVGLIVYRLRSK